MSRVRRSLLVLSGIIALVLASPAIVRTASCPTLQSQIDGAQAGSTLVPQPCIYRETIVVRKPLTIDGQYHAEIRGSDMWTSWSQSGTTWISSLTYPNVGDDSAASSGSGDGIYLDKFRAFHVEQVFIDGQLLTQVPGAPASGQFALDASRHVLLADNPNGHTVEVSVRKRWMNTQSDAVTITNMTFHHAATGAFESAISSDLHKGFVVSNSTMTDAHGGMAGSGGSGEGGSKYVNNTFVNAGDVALGGYQGTGELVQYNTFQHNGFGGWDPAWQAGALKFSSMSNSTIDSNVVDGAFGMGLWCDIQCSNIVISNNRISNVGDVAIHFEISNTAHIFGNKVWHSGTRQASPGIYSASSSAAEIDHNTVYDIPASAIFVYRDNRPDAQAFVNNYVHDNVIVQTLDTFGLGFGDYTGGSLVAGGNNHGSGNAFWYPMAASGSNRFWWGPTQTPSLTTFNTTPGGGSNSRYLSDAEENQALLAAGIPFAASATPTPTSAPIATVAPAVAPRGWLCTLNISPQGVASGTCVPS